MSMQKEVTYDRWMLYVLYTLWVAIVVKLYKDGTNYKIWKYNTVRKYKNIKETTNYFKLYRSSSEKKFY